MPQERRRFRRYTVASLIVGMCGHLVPEHVEADGQQGGGPGRSGGVGADHDHVMGVPAGDIR